MTFHRTPHGYIEVPISEEMIAEAERYADSMDDQNRTIEGHQGRFIGSLGEQAFALFTGAPIRHSYEYDFLVDGVSYDVKTKNRTVVPDDTYEASQYAYNAKQNYDVFVAASVHRIGTVYHNVYLIGWLSKPEYVELQHYYKQGDVDPSNGTRFPEACFNVSYEKFHRFT